MGEVLELEEVGGSDVTEFGDELRLKQGCTSTCRAR